MDYLGAMTAMCVALELDDQAKRTAAGRSLLDAYSSTQLIATPEIQEPTTKLSKPSDEGAAAPLVIDIDATLVTAHSEKESAAPTFKRGFGFHPLWTFVDHGPAGGGEPLAVMLRAGNAGSNDAADHITVARAALAQLPGHRPGTRPGRTDGAAPPTSS